MTLQGKTALITGAAGVIGSAIGVRLQREGVKIVAVDVSAQRLALLKSSIPDATLLAADISTTAGCDHAVTAAKSRIDILVNSAGAADGGGSIDELNDETWSRVIGVNLTSAFMLSRRVVGPMIEAGGGVIVNMSSVAGLRGGRTGVAYTASKWALIGMVQNIAATLGSEGIRAYAICPGVVLGATTLSDVPATARSVKNRGRDAGQPPPTTAADVAETIAFLVSDSARHLNGIAVPIDRGWLAY